MSAGGEARWPPLGRNQWPLTHDLAADANAHSGRKLASLAAAAVKSQDVVYKRGAHLVGVAVAGQAVTRPATSFSISGWVIVSSGRAQRDSIDCRLM